MEKKMTERKEYCNSWRNSIFCGDQENVLPGKESAEQDNVILSNIILTATFVFLWIQIWIWSQLKR